MTADILAIQAAALVALEKHNKAQEKLKIASVQPLPPMPLLPTIPATVSVPLITIPAGLSTPPVIRFTPPEV